jgi:hypothetical protein
MDAYLFLLGVFLIAAGVGLTVGYAQDLVARRVRVRGRR